VFVLAAHLFVECCLAVNVKKSAAYFFEKQGLAIKYDRFLTSGFSLA
jgi:hypothetical protein